MTTPLYFDNFCLRFNSNLQALEYNSGNEVWLEVPVPTGDLGLLNGDILVGNASNLATAVTMSGAATISNTGVLTLAVPQYNTIAGNASGHGVVNNILRVDTVHNSVGINIAPDTTGNYDLKTNADILVGQDLSVTRNAYVNTDLFVGTILGISNGARTIISSNANGTGQPGGGGIVITDAAQTSDIVRISTANPSVAIGVNTGVDATAMLSVQSTTKGFLPPVMTQTQKQSIATPTVGLVVFDSTLIALCVYTGTGADMGWATVTAA